MESAIYSMPFSVVCMLRFVLEPVFIRNICGFSSIILLQTRQKCAGGLSPGKYFSRSMQQNLPKRHVYTLVKIGSYSEAEAITSVIKFAGSCSYRTGVSWKLPSPWVI